MKKILTILVFALLPVLAWAQSSIKVQGQNIVALGEQFSVAFVIDAGADNRPSDFRWNPGEDFQVVWGPQTGTSTSTYINNGKVSTSSQFTYSYILLAKKEGKYQLPAATATVGGNQISSKPYSVEVVKGEGGQQQWGGQSSGGGRSSSASGSVADISSDDLFMRLTLSRGSAVIGEPVKAVLKLYQKVNISGFEDVRFPTFNGFWSQVVEQPSNIDFQREVLGDKIYNSAVLRSWVLVPQQAGELKIDPSELTCLVNIKVPSRSSSIFDSFFDDNIRTIRKRVTSPAVKLTVSALPSGAPASFAGGVGEYSVSASLSRDSLVAHEAASLVITISGSGNVSLLEAPKVNFPPDFEVYDVKATEKTTQGGTSGSKSFEYPFIPRSRGDFTIEGTQWSYYDIKSRKYVTVNTPELAVAVSGGDDGASSASSSSGTGVRLPERGGVRSLSEDIRFIRTVKPSLGKGSPMLVSGGVYVILLLLMALSSVLYYAFRRFSAARKADVAASRGRRATKMALKRLSASKVYLDKNLDSAFYEELHRALLGFIADKFNMPLEQLDKENIISHLKEKGVPDSLADQFVSLVDACEYARYSPDSEGGSLKARYDSAVGVISSIDSTMKTGSQSSKMLTVIALILALGTQFSLAAAEPSDSLWTSGTEAYSDGDWQEAINCWQALEDEGYVSSALSYNLGNAYFKAGYLPKAILNYERALKADPSFSDARHNLEYANSFTQDRIDKVPEFILETWARSLCFSLRSDVWAVLSLLFFALFCYFSVKFLLGGGNGRRKVFCGAVAAVLLFAVTLAFANWQRKEFNRKDAAIVLSPVTSVKNSPSGGTSAKDLFVLHEGVKVRILDSVGQYTNIEISDGRQGWIKSSEIEII